MSYKDSDFSNEIQEQIALETINNGTKIDADQMAFRVISEHMPGFEKYSDFVTNCVWGHVRKKTGAELRLWRDKAAQSFDQSEMTGFERLQDYYEAESKEGNTVRVQRIKRQALTLEQRRAISNGLRSNGMALIEHADQFDQETDELVSAGLLI